MHDAEALRYLKGAPMRRWGWLIEWAFAVEQRPIPLARSMALDIAIEGLRFEYHGWRARMALNMCITGRDTRESFYTLSRILRRGKKGRRP